ncbi:MAG: type II toxin-antitoxin system VapC family toxin [Nitrospira sp.]|nr:type II toxin-antitoxin system VapC family toxin [Nitrospira sp.]
MDSVVLDTNIVSYLMKGHALAERYRSDLEGKTLAISFMTVGELFEGAFRNHWSEKQIDDLKLTLKKYIVAPYSQKLSETRGQIRAERLSQPISVDDAWIAATAVAHGCPLVTHNPKDFHGISALTLITRIPT